jgi:hypothetical protein
MRPPYPWEPRKNGRFKSRTGSDDDVVMQKGQRLRFVAIVGLVVALTTAGFALAGDVLSDTPEDPQPTVCPSTGGTVDEGSTIEDGDQGESEESEPVEGEEPVEGDEPVEGEPEECDEATDDAGGVEDPAGDATEAGEEAGLAQDSTADDCLVAAGLDAGAEPAEGPVPGVLHGLENSTAHLLWNCLDHPNHGLVNALTKHTAKLDAWLARQDLKAERKAEREAAKAERRAAHDAAKAARELSHAS